HCFGVWKDARDVGFEHDDSRPLCISACVLATNAGGEIVFRLHFRIIFLTSFLRKSFALVDSPVCTTTTNLPRCELPMITNRSSTSECAGSGIVSERASPKTPVRLGLRACHSAKN